MRYFQQWCKLFRVAHFQVEQSRHHKVPVVHIAKRYDGNRNSSFGAAFVSEDDYDKIVATADVLDEVTALRLGLEYEGKWVELIVYFLYLPKSDRQTDLIEMSIILSHLTDLLTM